MRILVSLPLPLMGKARPRCGQGRVYLPPEYREWKRRAADLLAAHWQEYNLPTITAAKHLHLTAYGPGRHDPDNLLGAVLDAGLPSRATGWRGCWRDDRVTVFPRTSFHWVRCSNEHWSLRIILPE